MGNLCERTGARNRVAASVALDLTGDGDDAVSAGSDPWIDAGISEGTFQHIVTEFATLDLNGDHRLNEAEFEHGAGKLPEFLGMGKEDIQHLFTKVDADHNGMISFKEFLSFMSERRHHMPLPVQVAPQKKRLEDNMKLLNFKLCTTDGGVSGVKGDGNCQFYSLSWHVLGTTSKHDKIRSRVVDHLGGPARLDVSPFYCPEHPLEPPTFDAWLEYMSKDRTWGDHFTLQAAADVFNLRIHVLGAGRWKPREKLPEGQSAGHCFGIVQVLEPQTKQSTPRHVWLSFAAQHYSPIQATPNTPPEVLGTM